MKAGGPLSRIRVVLLRPSHPGNIGAAARAMKTMGLTRLYRGRPREFPAPEAGALASSAVGLLASAKICADLDAALEGPRFSVAMSAPGRREPAHGPRGHGARFRIGKFPGPHQIEPRE